VLAIFIWCWRLNARISDIEADNERLEKMLRNQFELIHQKTETEPVKTPATVLLAIQNAKKQVTEQLSPKNTTTSTSSTTTFYRLNST
jgi:hypothetical protein